MKYSIMTKAMVTLALAVITAVTARAQIFFQESEYVARQGSTIEMGVCMNNGSINVTSLQYEIEVPNGVTPVGEPQLTSRSDDHIIAVERQETGAYRYLAYSGRNKSFKDASGVIVTATFVLDVEPGEYTIRLKEAYVTEAGTFTEYQCNDSHAKLVVVPRASDPGPGDSKPSFTTGDIVSLPGTTATMPIEMNNGSLAVTSLQMDVYLPAGVTMEPDVVLTDRAVDHVIVVNELEDGGYRLLAYSPSNSVMHGSEGVIANLTLTVGGDPGDHDISIKNAYVTKGGTLVELPCLETSATLSILWPGGTPVSMPHALYKGWNWMSICLSGYTTCELNDMTNNRLERMQSQTQEVVRDPLYGMVGNLDAIDATQSYKVQVSQETDVTMCGNALNAIETTVTLDKGWNWLGYVPTVTMSVDDALEMLDAQEGDIIKSKTQSATFTAGKWTGELTQLEPFNGYMYCSGKATSFTYPMRGKKTPKQVNARRLQEVPWSVDAHKYSDNATVIATLDGQEDWIVGAFVGDECRGIGTWVEGRIFLTIQGDAHDDMISLRAIDTATMEEWEIEETVNFGETAVGTFAQPLELHASAIMTTVDHPAAHRDAKGIYTIDGIKVEKKTKPGLYIVNGRVMKGGN